MRKRLLKSLGLAAVVSSAVFGADIFTITNLFNVTNTMELTDYVIGGSASNQVEIRIRNITPKKPFEPYASWFDPSATNIELRCSREPVLAGRTNGQWVIHFK